MRRAVLCLVLSLGSAFALARCTTSNNPLPLATEDSGLEFDSGPGPVIDSAAPADAAVDSSLPSPDSGSADAATDAGLDAPAEASVSCSGYHSPIEYDASADDGGLALVVNEEGGIEDGGLPDPDSICSATGTPPGVMITFVNDAPCPVELWWVDFNCDEELYGVLTPNGGSIPQSTFEGHVWRLREPGAETVLLQYVVPLSTTPGTVTYP
jgi:hypothetical protein